MHLPRDWTRTPGNAGGAAYPYALERPDGTSVVSVSSWGKPGTPALYDPDEGVISGIIAKGLIDKKTEAALDDQPLVYGAEWKVNGRFFGLLHVPEEMVRPNASLTALVAQGERPCTATPLLSWAGQSWSSASCWSAETRFPAARLLPYTGVPPAAYRVSGGAFSLQADLSRLTVRLEPPAGKTVTLTADLRCVPAPTGGCVA